LSNFGVALSLKYLGGRTNIRTVHLFRLRKEQLV
jgi:hypothetical protein